MNKEEVLDRYKKEGIDEGKENTNRQGDNHGFFALCALSFLLIIYQSLMNQPFGAVASLLFVFLSVGAFSRYTVKKNLSSVWNINRNNLPGLSGLVCLGNCISIHGDNQL